ncbi:MAG: hypothetical protein RIM99_14845 [Cyclobacteriaceae bacterium]
MKYFSFLLFVCIATGANAQNNLVVLNTGDSIYGKVSFLRPTKYSEKIVIKNDDGNQEVSANIIVRIQVKANVYKSIIQNNKYTIMQEVIPGYLGLYKFRPEDGHEFSTSFLYKATGEGMAISPIGFRRPLAEFIEECDDLSDAVTEKKYGFKDLNDVVTAYNSNCIRNTSVSSTPSEPSVNYADLSELQSLLKDVLTKVDNNEPIPEYLKKAVDDYTKKDINGMLNDLLKKISEN